MNGVTGYTLQFDDDDTFITPTATITTKGSSYLLASPQTKTDYYWRVRADFGSGLNSAYSDTRRFRILALRAPDGESPINDPDGFNPGIEDVVLSWDPVLGAKSYELRVSTDINFTSDGFTATTVTNTYSPSTTLNNDQFYWQVRPVDTLGNKPDWAEVDAWVFKREWPDQADHQYPADGATLGNPMFYQWKPIEHASKYLLQLSTDPTFATTYDTCSSVHTTYIPSKDGDCWPKSNVVTYWRIRGYDYPNNDPVVTDLIAAPVSEFTYSPAMVTLTSPLSGSVAVPTFRWQPLAGGNAYTLKVYRVSDGALVIDKGTYATSYTHTAALPTGVNYRWQVIATSDSGLQSPSVEPADQPTFNLIPPGGRVLVDAVASVTGRRGRVTTDAGDVVGARCGRHVLPHLPPRPRPDLAVGSIAHGVDGLPGAHPDGLLQRGELRLVRRRLRQQREDQRHAVVVPFVHDLPRPYGDRTAHLRDGARPRRCSDVLRQLLGGSDSAVLRDLGDADLRLGPGPGGLAIQHHVLP